MKQTLLLTILILLLAISCAAQSNSQKFVSDAKVHPVVIVEYTCNTDLDMKIARFVNELKKTRGAKAYVIVYADPKMAENVTYLIRNTNWMFQKRKIAPDRIVLLKGGFREHTTAEFFIVPKGAVPPVPTPTIDDKGMTLRP